MNYVLPGILLMAIASGIAFTALRLFTDLKSGIFERFHSIPNPRSSVLWAHVLTSLVANMLTVAAIFVVGLLMGFRTSASPLAWLSVTSIVNTIQNLFAQQPVGNDIWIALAWCVGILIVDYAFAMATYRRKIS